MRNQIEETQEEEYESTEDIIDQYTNEQHTQQDRRTSQGTNSITQMLRLQGETSEQESVSVQ